MSWLLVVKLSLLWILSTGASNYDDVPVVDSSFVQSDYEGSSCINIKALTDGNDTLEYNVTKLRVFQCWMIQAEEKQFITIQFLRLFVPQSRYGCNYYSSSENVVSIKTYDQFNFFGVQPKTYKYCKIELSRSLTFYSDRFRVEIDINTYYDQNFGFRMRYFLSSPNRNVVVDSYTYITSPGYPNQIVPHAVNSWRISLSPSSNATSLQFVMNHADVSSDCVLSIYDGLDSHSPQLARLTSYQFNQVLWSSSGPHLYIEFQSQSIYNGPYQGFNATIRATGFCEPGRFFCGDGENCFEAAQKCDSTKNCKNTAADEKGCGRCLPDEYQCGDGTDVCFKQSQLCDGTSDCRGGLDEKECASCAPSAFLCNKSQACVKKNWRCDGQKDCIYGEDEFNCTSEYQDIKLHLHRFVTSPDYPNWSPVSTMQATWNISLESGSLPIQLIMNQWDVDAYTVLEAYDGPIKSEATRIGRWRNYVSADSIKATSSGPHMLIYFHVSKYVRRGSGAYRGFNATVKVKGYCLPGTFPCGDGNCFSSQHKCNGKRDCHATGVDEKGCGSCDPDSFWCGPSSRGYRVCYTESERCDGHPDCSSKIAADEDHCESCAPGAFLCKWTNKCIYEKWRCDGQSDCHDNEDELDCSYPASRKVITAAIVGSLVCGLLLAIALGCTCKLYTLRIAPSSRNRRNRTLPTTPLSRISRELLQREAPPSYNMTVDAVEPSTESSRHRSSSSRRRRERRRRRRNREPRIRRAQPSQSTSSASTSLDTNRDDVVPEPSTSNNEVCPTSVVETNQTPATSTSTPANFSSPPDVSFVLAEMGLTDPPDLVQVLPPTADAPATTSQPNAETEAPPLPKKRPIPPVMVEAPFNTIMVDDIPSCVYPNPPSYHEALTEAPAVSDIPPPVASVPDESETKTFSSSPKEVFNKIWTKRDQKKPKKFFNFPFFQVFSIGQSNGGYQELQESADSVHLNDEQVQLISDFVSDDVTSRNDDVDSTAGSSSKGSGEENQFSDPKTVFEMQSYNAAPEELRNEDRGSPVSLLIETPSQPLPAPPDSFDESDNSAPRHEDTTAMELPSLSFIP